MVGVMSGRNTNAMDKRFERNGLVWRNIDGGWYRTCRKGSSIIAAFSFTYIEVSEASGAQWTDDSMKRTKESFKGYGNYLIHVENPYPEMHKFQEKKGKIFLWINGETIRTFFKEADKACELFEDAPNNTDNPYHMDCLSEDTFYLKSLFALRGLISGLMSVLDGSIDGVGEVDTLVTEMKEQGDALLTLSLALLGGQEVSLKGLDHVEWTEKEHGYLMVMIRAIAENFSLGVDTMDFDKKNHDIIRSGDYKEVKALLS